MNFQFSQTAATNASAGTTGGFTFAQQAAAPVAAATVTSSASLGLGGGFTFAQPTANGQAKSVRFDVAGTATVAAVPATTQSSLASLLSQSTPAAPTSIAPTGPGNALRPQLTIPTPSAAATTSTGTALGIQPTFGGLGGSLANTTTSMGGGSLFPSLAGGVTSTTAATGGLFGSTTATTASSQAGVVSLGLGGVVSTSGSTAASGSVKLCDAKAIKELSVPPEMITTVEEFTKHVKSQKCVREDIARMSSKPLYRVQEDIKNLHQQLLVVTAGLQRNAVIIDKLKRETAQDLKNMEIAQRTKDTPPGLQYENTAPIEYFQRLVEDFEVQMQLYRQQIVDMENHLASADSAASLTPHELSLLLGKLNEGFIALAAQLQVVHEAVKEQKEAYITYRQTVYGDSPDVLSSRSRSAGATQLTRLSTPTTIGPTPFASMSNSAAVAMATAMSRNQPTSAPALGLSCGVSSLGGSAQTSVQTGTGFGIGAAGSSLFGPTGAGLSTQSPYGTFGQPTTGLFGNTTASSSFGGGFGAQPFSLSKTPTGSKRGKNS